MLLPQSQTPVTIQTIHKRWTCVKNYTYKQFSTQLNDNNNPDLDSLTNTIQKSNLDGKCKKPENAASTSISSISINKPYATRIKQVDIVRIRETMKIII
ncbi:unnamed protein product [Rhizophagus irregularis]|nr:hypothetical protein RirG_062080 [Rhizophagus irregularis DAOM 197198w]EXX79227.1 hypothetical protein RirG_007680 [Rhizophagus irregularis DAOM 197198w]CAB4386586.1 unnamed protein product [Rhizophagus irregularis]CAB4463242.1 unnamed protein product [Rhizophagus irregularis]CAB5209558.1 unnamed protein product [Rhizophagus irregularis]